LVEIIKKLRLHIDERVDRVIQNKLFPELWYSVEKWALGATRKEVMSVGCGNGRIEKALIKSGWFVTCVDHDPAALVSMQGLLSGEETSSRFEQVDMKGEFPFEDECFNFIICLNYLEFLDHMSPSLKEMWRCLAPGGRALIALTNRQSLWSMTDVLRHLRPTMTKPAPRLMTGRELKRVLETTPFTIEYLRGKARYLPWPAPFSSSIMAPVPGMNLAYLLKPKT